MEQSEIVEGNKLIAQFMGYEYLPSHEPLEHGKKYGWNKKGVNINAFTMKQGMSAEYPPLKLYLGRSHHELQFNRNWSWLMPVVEKISSIGTVIPNERIGIVNIWAWVNGCKIDYNFRTKEEDPNSSNDSIFIKGKPKLIDSVFEAIAEFLKWYNLQNKK